MFLYSVTEEPVGTKVPPLFMPVSTVPFMPCTLTGTVLPPELIILLQDIFSRAL